MRKSQILLGEGTESDLKMAYSGGQPADRRARTRRDLRVPVYMNLPDDQRQSRPDAELSASDFYQFSEKPFEDNPDPKFFYLTASHQEIFASILTWIKEGNGFAVITGEAGTGKTFFIHALISHLDEKINPILVLNPVFTFKDLLKQILWVLKQPTQEKTETALFHQFTGFLDQMTAQDKTLLIILDETQSFNDEILDGIDRFLDLRSKLIRIIFVGQSHFDGRLNSLGLRRLGQKVETKQKIKPFTEEETRGYIDHRLRLVGSSSGIMTPRAISAICSYTQGISSLINHVCDNALWVGCSMNRKKIDIDIIEKVIKNLEGSRILPKALPSTKLIKRIWKTPVQFGISLKRVSIAIFLKVIRNLRRLRITPRLLSSIQLRRIWKFPVRFAIPFKKVSIAILLKLIQNSKYLRILPRASSSIQIGRIWKPPIQFVFSFQKFSKAALLKVVRSLEDLRKVAKIVLTRLTCISGVPIQFAVFLKIASRVISYKIGQNLRGLRVIPKIYPSIQLRQVRKSSVKVVAYFNRVLIIIFLKLKHNLKRTWMNPKLLLSVQLRGIWKPFIQFHISFKRVLLAAFFKLMQNLERLRIVPEVFGSIQLRRIWKTPIHFTKPFKRVPMVTFEVIRNLQIPETISKTLASIQRRWIWKLKPSRQFPIFFKKELMAVFLLISLGGLIFLIYGSVERGVMKIEATKPSDGQKMTIKPSTHTPPVQEAKEGMLKKERIQTSGEQKVTQPKSSSPKRNTAPLVPRKRKQEPAKVTANERLNMVSSIKEKELLPPAESGFKAGRPAEAPKPIHDISKVSKTQALTITHFSAADKGPYGCIWQIYIEAEDPEGDMDRISVEVDQVNYGHYPTEWIMIRPQYGRHLTGFLQWNTFSSKVSYLPEGTEISVKISIFDRAGNKSNAVIIPFTFGSGVIKRYQLPGPFDKGNIPRIGYIMVDLCYM